MGTEYLKSLHPVTAVLHWKIMDILKGYDIKTVLDVGGIGKLDKLTQYHITNANIEFGVDGCALPFEDNSFDATVSVATLEHVIDPLVFLQESYRVAKKVSVHWFPCGCYAEKVEKLKKKYGHLHPCRIPNPVEIDDVGIDFLWEEFSNCGDHLLLCMTLTPMLKAEEVYDYVVNYHDKPYGNILIGEK